MSLINLVVLFVFIALAIWQSVSGHTMSDSLADMLLSVLLTLGFVAVVSNAALGLARALSARSFLQPACWAILFLCLGSTATVVTTTAGSMKNMPVDGSSWDVDSLPEGSEELLLSVARGEQDILRSNLQPDSELAAAAAVIAIDYAQLSLLSELLDSGVSANSVWQGTSLLAAAINKNDIPVVEKLLQAGANVNQQDETGNSPLILAVIASNENLIKLLMQHGANPSLCNKDGYDARSFSSLDRILKLLKPPPSHDRKTT